VRKDLAIGLGAATVAVLAMLGSSKRSSAITSHPPTQRPGRILLIGDSFAVGLKPSLAALAKASGIPFEGHGTVGTRIDQWSSNPALPGYLSSFRPTLTLVSLGTNDEAAGTGFAVKQAPKLRALLTELRNAGSDVLWIGPPSLPFPRQGVSDMIRSSAPHYFESASLVLPRISDHLHPTAAGYVDWAKMIWSSITG
jgi:lysophospholipase L1-like esterase